MLAAIGIGAAVGLLNALLIEGLSDQPGDRHAGHDDRGPRRSALSRSARFNSWVEIKGPLFDQLARAHASLGIPLDALVALAARRCPLVRARAHRRSAAPGMRSATRRSPRASPACGCDGCARGAYVGCGALAGAGRRPGRGAHRPDQPVDRGRARVLRHRRGRARRRRPAGRPCRRAADAGRHADPDDGLQLHDHPRRARAPGRRRPPASCCSRRCSPAGWSSAASRRRRRPARPSATSSPA